MFKFIRLSPANVFKDNLKATVHLEFFMPGNKVNAREGLFIPTVELCLILSMIW